MVSSLWATNKSMSRVVFFGAVILLLLSLASTGKAQRLPEMAFTDAHDLTMIGKAEESKMFFIGWIRRCIKTYRA